MIRAGIFAHAVIWEAWYYQEISASIEKIIVDP